MTWTYNVRTRVFKLNGSFKFKAEYAGAPGYKTIQITNVKQTEGHYPEASTELQASLSGIKKLVHLLYGWSLTQAIICVVAAVFSFTVIAKNFPAQHLMAASSWLQIIVKPYGTVRIER